MSQDNPIATPETHEELLARYRQEMSARAANIAKEISAAPSNIIKTKGRVFTMPDGTTNPGPLRAVIVDFRSVNSFFEGAYNPSKPASPVCWAIGDLSTLAPSKNCPKPQTEGDCAGCPKNQFGTHPSGSKGKACKNTYRLALVPADLTAPDASKLYTLNVSPTGIRAFSAMIRRVQKLLGDDALPIRVALDIGFDMNNTYPTLLFTNEAINPNLGTALNLLHDARELLEREPRGDDEG